MIKYIQNCRLCNSPHLEEFLDLGLQNIQGAFYTKNNHYPPIRKIPNVVVRCDPKKGGCSLVQSNITVPPEILFSSYFYQSGINEMMRLHLKSVVDDLLTLNPNPKAALDIACIPPNHFVSTDKGLKKTENVMINDYVYTHTGKLKRVTKTYSREYSGNLLGFKFKGLNSELEFTDDHPLLTLNGWKKAKDIRVGDSVFTFGKFHFTKKKTLDLFKFISRKNKFHPKIENGRIVPTSHGLGNSIPQIIDLDDRFFKILAYYIGEGSGNGGSGISFSFNPEKEMGWAIEVQDYFKQVFDLNTEIVHVQSDDGSRNVLRVRVNSRYLNEIFENLCGHTAFNKQIPNVLRFDSSLFVFLKTLWFTDGHVNNVDHHLFSTVSRKLALQIRDLLFSLGINCTLNKVKNNRGFSKQDGFLFRVELSSAEENSKLEYAFKNGLPFEVKNGLIPRKVRYIETKHYTGSVYNLGVEQENSYVCDGVVVHNCNDLTLLRNYPKNVEKWGVDPNDIITRVNQDDINIINDFFPTEKLPSKTFDCISILAVMYDLDDPVAFLDAAMKKLSPDGVLVIEVMYLPSIIKNLALDTFLGEHLTHWSLFTLEKLIQKCYGRIIDVRETITNGGSILVFVTHDCCIKYDKLDAKNRILELKKQEFDLGLDDQTVFVDFRNRAEQWRKDLKTLVHKLKNDGKKLRLYGCSTKSNVMIQACSLEKYFDYGIERSEEKVGGKTLWDLPIKSEEEARKDVDENTVWFLGPYFFKLGVLRREKEFIDRGGEMLIPLPRILRINRNNEFLAI